MAFSLPEIQISSSNLYTALKIIFLVAAFIVIVFNVLSVNALPADYNFVYCYNEVTKSTFTYPEGTSCGELTDDDLEEEEEQDDEQEHANEEENN